MIILNLSESLAKPLVMAKLNMAYLSSLKNRAKLLLSSLPVSPSRVLRAPGTSSYHLVPKHLRATWPRPEQSHLLPEACSPNGIDNRQQHQRQTSSSDDGYIVKLGQHVLGKTLNSSVVVLSTTLNSCGAIEEMILWVLLQFAPLHSWFSFLVVPDLLCS